MNTKPHCWQFPPKGFLKLNTDASCRRYQQNKRGTSSYGAVLRDDSGGWVKAIYGKLRGLHTSVEAEVLGILIGIKMIKEFGYVKVIVETDCVPAMHMFTFVHLRQNHPLKDVIEKGLEILKESESVIVHTRRDGNECADRLAALGGQQDEEYNVVHAPPHEVMEVFLIDRFGIEYCRNTSAVWTSPLRIMQSPPCPVWALPILPLHHHLVPSHHPMSSPLRHHPMPLKMPMIVV